jgi:hypothetical protein
MPFDTETIVSKLVRMEEKLDSFLHRTTSLEHRTDGHDTRLRLLEQGQVKIYAVAGAIALGISVFGSDVLHAVGK